MQTEMLINGELVSGEGTEEQILNPATGKTEGSLRESSREQLDRAVAAAEKAFESWSQPHPAIVPACY